MTEPTSKPRAVEKGTTMSESRHAVVTHDHGDYKRGDLVKEPRLVEAMLRDHPAKCVAIELPEKT